MRDAAAVLSSHHYKTVTSKWSIEMVAIVGNVYYEIFYTDALLWGKNIHLYILQGVMDSFDCLDKVK